MLQVVVNGAWGEDWGGWSRGKKCHDCFSIPVLHDWTSWCSLEREPYKYKISSLQSTLRFKIGPDVKRTWSFLGWDPLNWKHSLCVVQSKRRFCWVTEPKHQRCSTRVNLSLSYYFSLFNGWKNIIKYVDSSTTTKWTADGLLPWRVEVCVSDRPSSHVTLRSSPPLWTSLTSPFPKQNPWGVKGNSDRVPCVWSLEMISWGPAGDQEGFLLATNWNNLLCWILKTLKFFVPEQMSSCSVTLLASISAHVVGLPVSLLNPQTGCKCPCFHVSLRSHSRGGGASFAFVCRVRCWLIACGWECEVFHLSGGAECLRSLIIPTSRHN